MRSFTFNLESVRRLRDHAERKAREEVARELSAREQHASEVARRNDAVDEAHDGARAAHPTVRGMWLALIERRKLERAKAEHALAEQEERVDESRSRATDAAREHEIISRLERRRRAEHARDVLRAEEAELGEIANAAYLRNQREGAE
jgi:flagellar export protein FliJ